MGVRLAVRSSWSRESAEVTYEFDQSRITIGRGSSADVRLPHPAVSHEHVTLQVQKVGYVALDSGSTNGTWVNGTRVIYNRPKALRDGDVLEVGGFRLTLTTSVPIARSTSADRTSAIARQLLRELRGGELDPPRLLVTNGPREGASLELPPPPVRLTLGRGEGCALSLDDADASREHVEIERDLDGVTARDLGSKNGLIVNDKPVRERRLRDRDELLVGATLLVFEDPAAAALADIEREADVTAEPPPAPGEVKADDEPANEEDAGASEEPSEAPDEPSAEGGDPSAAAVSAMAPPMVQPPARRSRGRGDRPINADVFIYILAALVLVASVVGLVVLLQAE